MNASRDPLHHQPSNCLLKLAAAHYSSLAFTHLRLVMDIPYCRMSHKIDLMVNRSGKEKRNQNMLQHTTTCGWVLLVAVSCLWNHSNAHGFTAATVARRSQQLPSWKQQNSNYNNHKIQLAASSNPSTSTSTRSTKVGDLLSSLPTPSLLVELSLMEKFLEETSSQEGDVLSVEDFLKDPMSHIHALPQEDGSRSLLQECGGSLFIHTRVTSTEKSDAVTQNEGSGKSLSVCEIDTCPSFVEGGAYLGLGLANHHVGGYYWARSMGIGASLPAHGIQFGHSTGDNNTPKNGELFWKKRGPGDPAETTEESSNSNDGKRSEWADFLRVGDTVQLVPNDPLAMLTTTESQFKVLLGIRRAGRPLGADPIVENIWNWNGKGSWTLQQ